MNLEQKIEAVLFYKNEPQSIKEVSKLLAVGEKEVREALKNLSTSLENRGICLVEREEDPKDQRTYRYKGSLELLAHLGIKKFEELPEFEAFKNKMAETINTETKNDAE